MPRKCSECRSPIFGRSNAALTCSKDCAATRIARRKLKAVKPSKTSDWMTEPDWSKARPQAELLARKKRAAELLTNGTVKPPAPFVPREHIDDTAMLPKDAEPDWNGYPPGRRRRRLMKLFAEAGYGEPV